MKLFPVYEELKQESSAEQEDMAFLQPERVISMLLDYSNPINLVYVCYILSENKAN
jgi:condensin complex subunit 3